MLIWRPAKASIRVRPDGKRLYRDCNNSNSRRVGNTALGEGPERAGLILFYLARCP